MVLCLILALVFVLPVCCGLAFRVDFLYLLPPPFGSSLSFVLPVVPFLFLLFLFLSLFFSLTYSLSGVLSCFRNNAWFDVFLLLTLMCSESFPFSVFHYRVIVLLCMHMVLISVYCF